MGDRLLFGVITTDCYIEYQRDIMNGIISQAFKASCDIAVISPLNNFSYPAEIHNYNGSVFDFILSDRFDGFIYNRNSFYRDDIRNYIDELCIRSGKPIMLLDAKFHEKFDTVSADDSIAFEKIVDHLIDEHGCRKIYFLTGPKDADCSEERLNGYFISMKKHKLKYDSSSCFYGDFWKNAPVDLADKILKGELEKPDAIVCGNDVMAVALTERLMGGGISVPGDIAVTGFDASFDAYRMNPSITSYRRPNFRLGAEALRRIYRRVTGKICQKIIDDDMEGIRMGRSCGCPENPRLVHSIQRRLKIDEDFSEKLNGGDMLMDSTNAADFDALMDIIDNHTYLIYKMNRICLCISDRYEKAMQSDFDDTLGFSINEPVRIALDKSAVHRYYNNSEPFACAGDILDKLRLEKKQPTAYYISPLGYKESKFGFCAVSFGKSPVTYSQLYIQWLKYINVALQSMLLKSRFKAKLRRLEAAALRDPLTGLLSRRGFFSACEKFFSELDGDASVSYMHIELPELKKQYYQCGAEESSEILRNFANILRAAISPDDLCGMITPCCFGILSTNNERDDDIFFFIRHRLENSAIDRGASFGAAFTIGTFAGCRADFNGFHELMHKAAVNRKHSYSHEDNGMNPQFEKICRLRSDLMKHPELEWNVGAVAEKLFISKSYLQKIYKHYFNRSIIEELIYFRMEKAKKLLTETDMTVTDISAECGYSTYNYFVRRFKSSENMSPSEYRELHKF